MWWKDKEIFSLDKSDNLFYSDELCFPWMTYLEAWSPDNTVACCVELIRRPSLFGDNCDRAFCFYRLFQCFSGKIEEVETIRWLANNHFLSSILIFMLNIFQLYFYILYFIKFILVIKLCKYIIYDIYIKYKI